MNGQLLRRAWCRHANKMLILHSMVRSFDLEMFVLAERIGVLDDADTAELSKRF